VLVTVDVVRRHRHRDDLRDRRFVRDAEATFADPNEN